MSGARLRNIRQALATVANLAATDARNRSKSGDKLLDRLQIHCGFSNSPASRVTECNECTIAATSAPTFDAGRFFG
jgi:hypothetical protein